MQKQITSARRFPVPAPFIERRIFVIRGQKIMVDSDLAELYQVPTKALNQAVKRNLDRFPDDFMFQLTNEEAGELNRSQIVTGSKNTVTLAFPCTPSPSLAWPCSLQS